MHNWASLLTSLLEKKGEFKWNTEADKALYQLKVAMSSAPVLALPDFSKPFMLEVNACTTGIGAVLMHDKIPLAFMSQSLSKWHQGLSAYEKKLIVLLEAVDKWRPYLLPHHFIIKTYRFSLKFLQELLKLNCYRMLSGWVVTLVSTCIFFLELVPILDTT